MEEEKEEEGLIVRGGAGQRYRLHTLVNEQLLLRRVCKCMHVAVRQCEALKQFIISYYSPPGQG